MKEIPALQPYDEHNARLAESVHPPDWTNPRASGRYNLVVIGAGTAGLVTAAAAAGLGGKVALIERELMGGDCLNVGCVPSKALIASAREAKSKGSKVEDFPAIMERMRKLRAGIAPVDSAARFTELGVDVFIGSGRFLSRNLVEVGGQELSFAKAVIATGGSAHAPKIDGLENIPYLTNETLFSLTRLPARMAIVGGGAIGCEMAQTFARLGANVTLIQRGKHLLPREDPAAAAIVEAALIEDGVQVLKSVNDLRLGHTAGVTNLDLSGRKIDVDALLVAVGRRANIEGLGLNEAGVETDSRGVVVNDRLQTTNPSIYAAGDVCSRYQFTHAADFMARTVVRNALFMGRAKVSDLNIPWCTYTDPELARVGLNEEEAAEKGVEIDVYEQPFEHVDRAILEGRTDGYARILTEKGKDRILGATIVGPHAGELLPQVVLAMNQGIGLGAIASSIHPYPTWADAVRKLGDQYNRTRLTPFVARLMAKWLKWKRS